MTTSADISAITYREATVDDLEAIATLYTHHWCNLVPDPADKMLAARMCVLAPLLRSPLTIVAELDGAVVGVCMGCVTHDGHVPEDARWRPAFDETFALATERAKTADKALEGQLFGDMREFAKADEFIATGSEYAQAQLNLFMVEPWLIGAGLGGELFGRMRGLLREGGATRFFLMTDTESNFAYYEHRGMVRIWERYDVPGDPTSWGALMYGGEL